MKIIPTHTLPIHILISPISEKTSKHLLRPALTSQLSHSKALPGLSQRLKTGVRQQVKEEPLLFWIGLIGVPAAILTPITTYYDLRRRPEIAPQEQHLLVTQEILRQGISALTHFITYYGSIILIGLNLREGSKYKSLKQLGGAALMTAIGSGIIRPMITNTFLAKHASHINNPPTTTEPSPFVLPTQVFQ